MNDILLLKGQFEQKAHPQSGGGRNIPKNEWVTAKHMQRLQKDLQEVKKVWETDTLLNNKLVTVYYNRIIAKSNRIQELFTSKSVSVVGAQFTETKPQKHSITHCISLDEIQSAIDKLNKCLEICRIKNWHRISHDLLENINNQNEKIDYSLLSKSAFITIIADSFYIENFGIDDERQDYDHDVLITLFETGIQASVLLRKLGILYNKTNPLDEMTVLLDKDQYAILKAKAPYLIAMSVTDLNTIEADDVSKECDFISERTIPAPKNEPVIGVIDTQFDEQVYFSGWVEYKNMLAPAIPLDYKDLFHGTHVTSLIVDGPALNPELDDGCGRFKVRHFAVATAGHFSFITIIRNIREIIAANRDIKVWNLSLGAELEIQKNSVSPVAYLLDKIQFENDVIFVIAGTNKTALGQQKIGSPADSINSLVVNSVDFTGKSASYTREGPVLSFFNKPDVSYYGGEIETPITVYGPGGECKKCGTSFAAPWIARKLAYLIHILGFSREVAKALIIDASCGWEQSGNPAVSCGYGVVPKRIESICKSENDEIKFILAGVSEKFDAYNFNIPVPVSKEQHPFAARATLCYFPNCARNQGVDYTETELDVHFGRIGDNAKIKSIDNNMQSEAEPVCITEEDARSDYRKWDNVKIVRETITGRSKKKYKTGLWGISIKSKQRITKPLRDKIPFGVIITLKEISGVNRLEDFIQACSLKGWLVHRINVENRIDIYNKAEAEITFEE